MVHTPDSSLRADNSERPIQADSSTNVDSEQRDKAFDIIRDGWLIYKNTGYQGSEQQRVQAAAQKLEEGVRLFRQLNLEIPRRATELAKTLNIKIEDIK